MRNFPKLFLAIYLMISTSSILGQENGTLRGFVTDSLSSESLVYASAYIQELKVGAYSDSHGYFLIPSLPSGKPLTLIVSYIGYRAKTLTVTIPKGKLIQYNIPLVQDKIQFQTIEQIGKRNFGENGIDISSQKISLRDMQMMPKGVETDVFRTLKYVAGVQSTGDVSAKYYVRGGASNQNLVMVDGITIYYPFHALGLFSVIDPDIVNSIEFLKGGYSAKYGERLSSVMQISTRDGNKNDFSSTFSASLLSGKFLLEGPIPHGSVMVAGRKSYSTSIVKKFFDEQNVPIDFYDFSFKLNYSDPEFIKGAKFTLNGFSSSDNIKNDNPSIEDYQWKNNSFGIKWFQVADVPLFFELGIFLSSFEGSNIPKSSDVFKMKNNLKDMGINMDFNYMFENRDEINIGFHIKHVQTDLEMENSQGVPVKLQTGGANIVFFGRYNFLQSDLFKFDIGSRINLTTLSKNESAISYEPRFNVSLGLFDGLSIKGAAGIFQQELTTITNENEVINIFEPWLITPDYLKPANSVHYILGLDATFIPNFTFTVEGYHKQTNDVPMLNQNKIFITDLDFIKTSNEAYGVEFGSKLTLPIFTLNASYTYSHVYREINKLLYYPKYDIRNSLNLSLEMNFGNGWTSSIVWVYNSGLPFTQIVGYYDKYFFEDFFKQWHEYDPRSPYAILGIQNLGRLPDYHRLDFSINKNFTLDIFKIDVGLSFINVYNKENIFYFKRDNGKRVNMLPFLPSAQIKIQI